MFHNPDKIPEHNLATKYIFEQGKIVGNLAKKLFPGGVDIPEDFSLNIKKTQELLKQRKTLFEAKFSVSSLGNTPSDTLRNIYRHEKG